MRATLTTVQNLTDDEIWRWWVTQKNGVVKDRDKWFFQTNRRAAIELALPDYVQARHMEILVGDEAALNPDEVALRREVLQGTAINLSPHQAPEVRFQRVGDQNWTLTVDGATRRYQASDLEAAIIQAYEILRTYQEIAIA